MDEVAAFLRSLPPFDALPEPELARLAAAARIAAFAGGETIFGQGAGPQTSMWVVCEGGVELVDHGRVLDLLGPGELFGHASMLAELPTGFAARAAGETTCLCLPGDVTRPLLARPEGLRHVARTLLGRPAGGRALAGAQARGERPVGALLRGPALVGAPDTAIRDGARGMTEWGAACAIAPLGDGALGVLTDHDLRSRVVAAGLPADAPVRAAMTAPAYTV